MGDTPTSLICPACHQLLSRRTWKNIELDMCSQGCHGIWFDVNELYAVEESDTLEHLEAAFVGTFEQKPLQEFFKDPPRRCPKDGGPLLRYEWNLGSKIVMDSCDQCKGIWLDEGELEAYAGYIKTFQAHPPELTPELRAKMDTVTKGVHAQMEQADEDALHRVVRWDIGPFDDMLRGLIKLVLD